LQPHEACEQSANGLSFNRFRTSELTINVPFAVRSAFRNDWLGGLADTNKNLYFEPQNFIKIYSYNLKKLNIFIVGNIKIHLLQL